MRLVIAVYTLGTDKLLEVDRARGVDQRIGRLDIAARAVEAVKDCVEALGIGDEIAIAIHIDKAGRAVILYKDVFEEASTETQILNHIIKCLRKPDRSCDTVETDLETLVNSINTEKKIMLSERGRDIETENLNTKSILMVLGAETDPPNNLGLEAISIGPHPYHTDTVITYVIWKMKRIGKTA